MAVDFKVKRHDIRDVYIIEVWVNNKFRATITPTDRGFRVLSDYFAAIDYVPGTPMVMEFAFSDKPTEFVGSH